MYDLCQFGFIYDSDSPEALACNDAALDRLMQRAKKTPNKSGLAVHQTGELHLSQAIEFPTEGGFNIPFSWEGVGGASRLYQHGHHGGVKMISGGDAHPWRWRFSDVTLIGHDLHKQGIGLRAEGTAIGKHAEIERVEVQGFGLGGALYGWYGGGIELCNFDRNFDGLIVDLCNQVRLGRVTVRGNDNRGFVMPGADPLQNDSISGEIYPESNGGMGYELAELTNSSLTIWAEANRDVWAAQGVLRNCWGNRFAGQLGLPICDELSARGNEFNSRFRLGADTLVTDDLQVRHVGQTMPQGLIDHEDNSFTVEVDAFNDPSAWASFGYLWITRSGQLEIPLLAESGDKLILRGEVVIDEDTRTYFYDRMHAALRGHLVRFQPTAGIGISDFQYPHFYPRGLRTPFELVATVQETISFARFHATLHNLWASGPSQDYRVWFENLELHKLSVA